MSIIFVFDQKEANEKNSKEKYLKKRNRQDVWVQRINKKL